MHLDEPTSALDAAHERHLIETLRGLKRLRTIVLVTHRLESVEACDRVYVLGGGRIVETRQPRPGDHLRLV